MTSTTLAIFDVTRGDKAPVVMCTRSSWFDAVWFAMALVLAACGRSDLTAIGAAGETQPNTAGASPTSAGVGGSSAEIAGAPGIPGPVGANGGGGGTEGEVTPPNSIRLHDFGDHQVVQRALGGSTQRVRIGGTVGSSIASLQAQVVRFETDAAVIVPWTDLGTPSDAAFSGVLEVPQGGWYRIVVRGLDELGHEVARAAGAHRWGVGINILCIGQSNMVGHGGHSYTLAGDLAGLYGNDRSWKHLADPYDSGGSSSDVDFDFGSGASLVPSLVNTLHAYLPGLPIGIVPAAKGSSPLVCVGSEGCWGQRNADDPADPSTLYGNSLAKARSAGGVELIVMHQGETDATNSTPRAAYAAELARLAQSYRSDLGEVPLFMCQLGRSTTDIAVKNRTDATMQAVRMAQLDADAPPRVYLAATAIDLDVDETDHYVKATLDELGRRIAAAIAYHYRVPGAPSAYRGPEIASVAYADDSRTVIDVHVSHRGGADIAPAADINGFVVLDDGAPAPLASVARAGATTIRITLETAIAGAGSVRYLYGKLPFQTLSNTVHDDSSLALPLEPTTNDLLLP
jgi:hypothetical protein